MEFKEIQVEILRGSCNFPSGNIHLSATGDLSWRP